MPERTITCRKETKDEWDSLKRQLAAAVDRKIPDPELVELLLALGHAHMALLEGLAGGAKSEKSG